MFVTLKIVTLAFSFLPYLLIALAFFPSTYNTMRNEICGSFSPATPFASVYGAMFHCGPFAAPLDVRDPAFLDVRSAAKSSDRVFEKLARGLRLPMEVHWCFVPECEEMKRRLAQVGSDMKSVGTKLLTANNEILRLVDR